MLAPEEILPRLQASQNSAATHIATHADARSGSLLESVARLQLVEMGLPAPVHRLDFETYLLGTSDAHTPNRTSDYAGVYRMLRTRQASFVWLEQRVGLAMVASDAALPYVDAPTPEGWHMVQVRWEDFLSFFAGASRETASLFSAAWVSAFWVHKIYSNIGI